MMDVTTTILPQIKLQKDESELNTRATEESEFLDDLYIAQFHVTFSSTSVLI